MRPAYQQHCNFASSFRGALERSVMAFSIDFAKHPCCWGYLAEDSPKSKALMPGFSV